MQENEMILMQKKEKEEEDMRTEQVCHDYNDVYLKKMVSQNA
jgi:hypothetical protein